MYKKEKDTENAGCILICYNLLDKDIKFNWISVKCNM